jgi:hypothetical protein
MSCYAKTTILNKVKKNKEDRSWNKYQTRSKYINGEPDDHLQAKKKIAAVLEGHGYTVWLEPNIAEYRPILHKGRWYKEWYVDGFASSVYKRDQIIYQVDGGYHTATKIQMGRTKNRDDTLSKYCKTFDIRYIVFDSVDDVLHEYTDPQLTKMLGL